MQIKLGLTGKKLHDSLTNLLPVPRLRLLVWSALAAAWPNVLSTIQDGELLPCSSGFVPSSIKQTHLGNSIERNWRNVMKEYIPHFLFQRFFRGYPCWKKSNRTQNTTSSTENEGQFFKMDPLHVNECNRWPISVGPSPFTRSLSLSYERFVD